MIKLYSYFRSSASFRVRIALNLKGLPFEYLPVHLLRDGGQQLSDAYRALNPEALVPLLVDDGVAPIPQSMAILEYLEETHPEPPLLPRAPADRAQVRALAQAVACDIHPLDNLRVLKYLKRELKVSDETKDTWYRHWVEVGFDALEKRLAGLPQSGDCCFGDTPTLADCCLIPQVFNAQRLNVDLTPFPRISRIHAHCMTLDAFAQAAPAAQPDAE